MTKIYKDPYQILDTDTFRSFSKSINEEITKEQTSNRWFEEAIASSLWGAVGLSGFTLYPALRNFFWKRELKDTSRNILKYQFDRISKGASINEEIAINICIFSLIGYEMHDYKLNEQSLYLVQKFLLRSISKLSINAAQVSLAKDMDEANYSILQHVILSSITLLCYYYETIGYVDLFCKKAMIELIISLKRNLCTPELIKHPFYNVLSGYQKVSIEDCLRDSFFDQYVLSISDSNTQEQIELLVKRNKDKILEDSNQYYGTYLYIEKLSQGESYDKIESYLKNNYFRFICPSYQYLLECCKKYHKEMILLNIEKSRKEHLYKRNVHTILSLATWLKNNRNYDCIKCKNPKELANDITFYLKEKQI